MNPRTFMISFIIILSLFLYASEKELDKSRLKVATKYDTVVETILQSSECNRTKILMESLIRHAQDYGYAVTCTLINPDK